MPTFSLTSSLSAQTISFLTSSPRRFSISNLSSGQEYARSFEVKSSSPFVHTDMEKVESLLLINLSTRLPSTDRKKPPPFRRLLFSCSSWELAQGESNITQLSTVQRNKTNRSYLPGWFAAAVDPPSLSTSLLHPPEALLLGATPSPRRWINFLCRAKLNYQVFRP